MTGNIGALMSFSCAVVLGAFIAGRINEGLAPIDLSALGELVSISALEELVSAHAITFVYIFLLPVALSYYFKFVLGYEEIRHKMYDNGVSVLFALRILAMGPGFQSLMKVTAATTRRRIYSGMRRFVFFGREIWSAGHPALCKHIFQPSNSKLWHKVDKPTLNRVFFQTDVPNNAMLYTGDDNRWKHARMTWSKFFMDTDFSCYDKQIDDIVSRHLIRLLKYRSGRAELLELMLYITIDLLCQVLYGANLPQDELNILVESLAEFTVPATKHRGKYPGGLDCKDYHSKIAKEISDKAPDGVFVKVIMNDEKMTEELRYENCAFFLEALTPAFASFWTLANIILKGAVDKNMKEECLKNPTFREQCIKESLRMYPPVPALWGRIANETHTFNNPLYDENVDDQRSFFGKLFSEPDIRTVETITIKKDTMVMVIPACLHYDDRVWMNAEEFLPSRWNEDPHIIQENFTTARKARQSTWGALALGKGEDVMAKLEQEKAKKRMKKGGYDADAIPMRYKLFGPEYEGAVEDENREHLHVATEVEDLMSYSFFPFGLGKHMCLGRRLAVKMVDGIVANLLSFDINFENGVTPNLFKRHWTDRLNSVSAVYNYPADPVYVEFAECKGDIARIESMFTKEAREARKSRFSKLIKLSVLTAKTGLVKFDSMDEEKAPEPKKCAVLFVTCQNEFLDPEGKLYSRVEKVMTKLDTKKHLKQLMDAAAKYDALVFHSPVEIKEGAKFGDGGFDEWKLSSESGVFAPGSWGAEFYKDTLAAHGDIVLSGRKTSDCITGTNLLMALKNNQIDVLFIAGLLTDVTIENTVSELAKKIKGGHLDLEVHPVSDATAAFTMEAHKSAYDFVMNKCSKPVTTNLAVKLMESNMNKW